MQNYPDSPHVIALPPLIFFITVIAGLVANFFWPLPFVDWEYRVWIGILITIAGLAFAKYSVNVFRKAGTNVDVRQPVLKIVQTGPFRYSRNPMYLSMVVFVIGTAIWANSLWILIALIPAFLLIRFGVIKREEAYLEGKFGDEYRAYKAKVRRFI